VSINLNSCHWQKRSSHVASLFCQKKYVDKSSRIERARYFIQGTFFLGILRSVSRMGRCAQTFVIYQLLFDAHQQGSVRILLSKNVEKMLLMAHVTLAQIRFIYILWVTIFFLTSIKIAIIMYFGKTRSIFDYKFSWICRDCNLPSPHYYILWVILILLKTELRQPIPLRHPVLYFVPHEWIRPHACATYYKFLDIGVCLEVKPAALTRFPQIIRYMPRCVLFWAQDMSLQLAWNEISNHCCHH